MMQSFAAPTAKIIGIQFGMLSDEEKLRSSVVKIFNRDMYAGKVPITNSLADIRMGVLEPGIICPTDNLDYMSTPGYHGHIELARPVFYIQFMKDIQKWLHCVCFQCGKVLISKRKHANLLALPSVQRYRKVSELCGGVKRCGADTDDGCDCLQPDKIRKEGFATFIAEWKRPVAGSEHLPASKRETETISIKLTPEIVSKIFRRISDEDVDFIGFNHIFARPEWMICQVYLVPPPAIRPSVKHDAQQRSEDDMTHILLNLLKTNNTLFEKIQSNAAAKVIDDWSDTLQYYVAALVDNKMPGIFAMTNRSNRPLKSIRDRLNGKQGRMRGNLMAKRVDFSARSVITGEPNLSVAELGVPMAIAMNLTKPVVVNHRNRAFLTQLVRNGPDVYPGAKRLARAASDSSITLRYMERNNIVLEDGDVVHRHLMDGDYGLFNRQPTLHRMSMQGFLLRIMKHGNTFRFNVAAAANFNADYDGDEMNLHIPQDPMAEIELRELAAVQYQIISPGNNGPTISLVQDNLLGAYLYTAEGVSFTPKVAMNLLMRFPRVNLATLFAGSAATGRVTNFDILSQITPPISLKYKTNGFADGEDAATSNNVLEIRNGKYIRGRINKSVVSGGSKSIVQRVCNGFGNQSCLQYIDDIQSIVTEFMKQESFSVGISDLISNTKTRTDIAAVIDGKRAEVKDKIDQVMLGTFVNNTGRTNKEEFEMQVTTILSQASGEAGKIAIKSLDRSNRFVEMVKAGSKGNESNIAFMTSGLGQQTVEGRRIPDGFNGRTLPHFTKYNESPVARGFVVNSYVAGLSPSDLFFHAMAGRIGLIDTAVKTSATGYIQRRVMKGLEDLKACYDHTVRSNQGDIIQYAYGEDNIDTIKVETQTLSLVSMSVQDIYAYYNFPDNRKTLAAIFTKPVLSQLLNREHAETLTTCKSWTDRMIQYRDDIIKYVFKFRSENTVNCPVAFAYVIGNIAGQLNINQHSMVDITPLEVFGLVERTMAELDMITTAPPTALFRAMFYFHLCPKELLVIKRFNRAAITVLLDTIKLNYKQAIVAPGEMVGPVAAQSIGQVSTQMTLNTFHNIGIAAKSNVTRGVPRMEEILSLTDSAIMKNPSLTVFLKQEDMTRKDRAQDIMHMLEHTTLQELVQTTEITYDPDDGATLIAQDRDLLAQYYAFENLVEECAGGGAAGAAAAGDGAAAIDRSKWILRMEMDAESMLEKNITMDDIHFTLNSVYGDDIACVYSDFNADRLIFRIRIANVISKATAAAKSSVNKKALDQSDQIFMLKNFQDNLLQNVVIRGVKNIRKVMLRKVKNILVEQNGAYVQQDQWVLDTVGSNLLDILALDYIDKYRTVSNDIVEVYNVLGIEAARQVIYNELQEVIRFDGTYVNYHHFSVLCDRMTYTNRLISIGRHGINSDNIGPIAKASFEETPEMFINAAKFGELDTMTGVSANVMCGQEGMYGTSAFEVLLDMAQMKNMKAVEHVVVDREAALGEFFHGQGVAVGHEQCSVEQLSIANNVANIAATFMGTVDDEYELF